MADSFTTQTREKIKLVDLADGTFALATYAFPGTRGYTRLIAAENANVVVGKGVLLGIVWEDAGAGTPTIQIWDGADGEGTVILGPMTPPTDIPWQLAIPFDTGLTVTLAGDTSPKVGLMYVTLG